MGASDPAVLKTGPPPSSTNQNAVLHSPAGLLVTAAWPRPSCLSGGNRTGTSLVSGRVVRTGCLDHTQLNLGNPDPFSTHGFAALKISSLRTAPARAAEAHVLTGSSMSAGEPSHVPTRVQNRQAWVSAWTLPKWAFGCRGHAASGSATSACSPRGAAVTSSSRAGVRVRNNAHALGPASCRVPEEHVARISCSQTSA